MLLKTTKQLVVDLIGRESANRIASPFYDWAARQKSRRKLATIPTQGLCVHIGCGPTILSGWINVDVSRHEDIDLVWDLRKGLPFPENSCSAIFGEHVIEHISKDDALALVRECYRALEKGGVLRFSTPDAALFLRAYVEDRSFLNHSGFAAKVETPLDRINIMMREDGQHLWVYDAESLMLLMQNAGFASVSQQPFGVSQHEKMNNLDSQGRAFQSLYVEAVK